MKASRKQAWDELPRSHGLPVAGGILRRDPEDFVVSENLGFTPDGDGEHVLLLVRKRGWNTPDVARWLSRALEVPARDVTWAGLKDRHAVTEQWFGIRLPGRQPVLPDPPAGLSWRSPKRHRRRLRPGALAGNRFTLVIRHVSGQPSPIHRRLLKISRYGVPNYFGPQRFGHDGRNLVGAERLFGGGRERDRTRRGLYLSAARSFLFNRVLGCRVADGSWDRALVGDLMTFAGSRSVFSAAADTAADPRLSQLDIHPTGPLVGSDGIPVEGRPAEVEETVLATFPAYVRGLRSAGLRAERRALRLPVSALRWQRLPDAAWRIAFTLPPGGYATAVLRELGAFEDVAVPIGGGQARSRT